RQRCRRPVRPSRRARLAGPRMTVGAHPLVDAAPDVDTPRPLMELHDVRREFVVGRSLIPGRRRTLTAVDGVTLSVRRGETLGLVGESGSGKTTLGRVIAQAIEPTAGTILLDGQDVTRSSRSERKANRRRVQMIFQDPYSS